MNEFNAKFNNKNIASLHGINLLPKDIISLYFSNNKLLGPECDPAFTPKIFEPFKNKLKYLILNNTLFTTLPTAIGNLKNLKELAINNSQIAKLTKDCLKNLILLEDVRLNNCSLKELPEDLFKHNNKLTDIFFEDNQLQTIPEKLIENLENVESISFSGNPLITFPNLKTFFKGQKKLPCLKLANTKIAEKTRKNLKKNYRELETEKEYNNPWYNILFEKPTYIYEYL